MHIKCGNWMSFIEATRISHYLVCCVDDAVLLKLLVKIYFVLIQGCVDWKLNV